MKFCHLCARKKFISFNWKYAYEGKDKDLAEFASHLQAIRPLKFGYLYQCPLSKNNWFLNDDESYIYSVPSHKVEMLWRWDKTSLTFSNAQIKILSEIGATESDQYGNGKGEVKIPCSIRSVSGDLYDPALVVITKMPPIHEWQKRVILGRPNTSITPSDYALPLKVRIATLNADELRMGFAPTLVKSSDNQHFILNWSNHIFSYGQLKGKDISLAEQSFSFSHSINFPTINRAIEQIVLFYYDWYDGCQKLIRESAS